MERSPELRGNSIVAHRITVAARNRAPVSGLTHDHYRYPARFSPTFARSVIEQFTAPGDWVFDPFAGGGTTLVESLALGRNALGIDISQLAAFVSEAKTLQLSDRDHAAVERWICRLPEVVHMRAPSVHFEAYATAGYYRNLEGPDFWRLRKAIEQCLASVVRLRLDAARTLARCVVLRTAQWALDAREQRPSIPQFRSELIERAKAMLEASLNSPLTMCPS